MTISLATQTCSFVFVASSPFSSIEEGGLQQLVDSGWSSFMVDPEMIPNANQHLREYQALQPLKIVYAAGSHELLATGTTKLTIGVENTLGKQREVNMSVMLAPGLGRNLLSSSGAGKRGRDDNICVSCAKSKGRNVPVETQPYLYFLDAILPELPSECINVGETSGVMLWHRRSGHINAHIVKKLQNENGTGEVVKDTAFSVSNYDTCTPAKSKQQNHAKAALVEVTMPIELEYTDLSGPISIAFEGIALWPNSLTTARA